MTSTRVCPVLSLVQFYVQISKSVLLLTHAKQCQLIHRRCQTKWCTSSVANNPSVPLLTGIKFAEGVYSREAGQFKRTRQSRHHMCSTISPHEKIFQKSCSELSLRSVFLYTQKISSCSIFQSCSSAKRFQMLYFFEISPKSTELNGFFQDQIYYYRLLKSTAFYIWNILNFRPISILSILLSSCSPCTARKTLFKFWCREPQY